MNEFLKNKYGEKIEVAERFFETGEGSYEKFRETIIKTEIKLKKGQATHVLRHTFASHFMQNGGDILTLQRILDHSGLRMTMNYAHLAPNHLEQAKLLNPLSRLTVC